MKSIVTHLYATFNRYADEMRAIPSCIDGLKIVERRLLLALYDVASKSKPVKSAKVVGHLIGTYHAHGDCLHEDTEIYDVNGNIYKISDLINNSNPIKVLAYDYDLNKVVESNAINFRKGKRVLIQYVITFNDVKGSIKCSSDHKILTGRGWIKAEDLLISDKVLSTDKLTYNTSFKKISDIMEVTYKEPIQMYDFTVDNYENMFIKVGDQLLCVHNSSAYETLVGMVNRQFAIGQGNWGRPGIFDDSAGAMRYTEVRLNPAVHDWFAPTIKFVPWENIELDDEPLYLPSMLPLGLVGHTITQGIGGVNAVKSPRYNAVDLGNRLYDLLTNNPNKIVIKPIIKGCEVYEETPGDFENILSTGNGCLQIVPNATINEDYILVTGKHPVGGFSKLITLNTKFEEETGQPYCDLVDLSKDGNIVVQILPRKGKVTNDFSHKIMLSISTKLNILNNFVTEDGVVRIHSIDEILLNCFNKWKLSILKKLEHDLDNEHRKLFELDVLSIIRTLFEQNPTVKKVDDIVTLYNNSTLKVPNITDKDIKSAISGKTIRSLIEKDLDKTKVETNITDIEYNINNNDNITLDKVKQFIGK